MSGRFNYKYEAPSIKERNEIDSIRRAYLPKEQASSKLDRLRSLDNRVNTIPMIYSLSFGIIGILLFGVALTFFLEWTSLWFIGIPVGMVGIALMAFAYPVHNKVLLRYKNKYGPEIIALSNELLEEEE